MASGWQLGRRPGLDGLRGIAILLVMVDHAGVHVASRGGAAGVTLFFVLSGFLITTLLLDERQRSGTVSLRRFYWRRVLRLLPALLIFLAAVTLVMLVAGRGDEIAGDVGPTLLYYMNWSTVAGNNPGLLSHTWSLSIEEQFYLAWPISLLGLLWMARGRSSWAVAALAGATIVAVVLRSVVWSTPAGYHRAYFGTDTRMDALAIGCLLALAFAHRPLRPPGWVTLGAVAAVVAAILATDDASMAKVGLLVVAMAGAVLVAAAATGVGERLLGWWPLAWLGAVSYGLYLWHRPVMKAFTDSGLGGLPWSVAVMFVLAIGLAWLSRRFVEEPFLRLKDRYFSSAGPPRGLSASPTNAKPTS